MDECLTCQIVAKIVEDDPGLQDQVDELERLYMLMKTSECDLLDSYCVRSIHNTNSEEHLQLDCRLLRLIHC